MTDSFWKTLGSTLVDAGAAYLQQVRLVEELKHLSTDDALARFSKYVQGLTSTARAGFAVTLAVLENNESSADAKHLIASLRAALAGEPSTPAASADASSPAAPTPAAPSRVAAPRPAVAPPTFDADLQRVSEWHDVEGEQRAQTVIDYLESLDLDGLESLHDHLETMQKNCATNIQNHRDNEARIAAGRFVEDQMMYRASVIAGGRRDPDWLRTLQELEGWASWFDAVHKAVGGVIEERRRPPTPPAPPAIPAKPAEAAKHAKHAPPAKHAKHAKPTNSAESAKHAEPALPAAPQRSDKLRALDEMKQMLEQQLASGEVRGERAIGLRGVLDKMETLFEAVDRGEIDNAQAVSRMTQLYADVAPLIADPGSKRRAASGSPRLREIDAYAGAMKIALGRVMMASPPPATAQALGAVLGDLAQFQQEVAKVKDDEALSQLEADLLRPAAKASHELAMARNALLARPLWESVDYLPAVNGIAYCGAADLQQQLEAALAPRGLAVLNTQRMKHHGQVRWDELNSCHVAFFDLRGASDIAGLAATAPKRARELAAAAYELGIAFALGKPVVVTGAEGEAMPFDVDLTAVELAGDEGDAALLAQAVDEAFYVPQRSGSSSSIGETVAFLDRLTRHHPKRKAFEGMGWLDPALTEDPAGFVGKTEQIIRALPEQRWRLLRPAWPAAYPDAASKRCFHVMPFGQSWSDEVRDVARLACRERGLIYRRGDEAEEGRIIHAIWDDLCRAHVALVDVSGANLNVMIELGIAHAIGRPVLAVRRRDLPDVRPKHIEKLRVLPYASASELTGILLTKLPA
jgi:nucleoside 2-deoxyribosyltransferase